MDPTPKPWWQSRTIIGAVMVIVAQALHEHHIEIGSDELTDTAIQALTLTGSLMAIWGRIKASRPIALVGAKTTTLPEPKTEAAIPATPAAQTTSAQRVKDGGFTKGSGGTAGFCRTLVLPALAVLLCGGLCAVALSGTWRVDRYGMSASPCHRQARQACCYSDAVVWRTSVDTRPFWERLLLSLRVIDTRDPHIAAVGGTHPMLVGGAEF